jgi:Ni/Co efflux regulator RcnB
MKRIAMAALAAATFAAPLAIAAPAFADPPRHERGDNDRGEYRGDRNRGDRDWDNRDDRRDERDAYRDGRRDERRADRWDDRRYNGYTSNGRWYYGRPGADVRDARYEYRQWRRGDRLSQYHRGRVHRVDYRREHLRAPPRGYHYVRDDRGDTLLVGLATGVILAVILSQ